MLSDALLQASLLTHEIWPLQLPPSHITFFSPPRVPQHLYSGGLTNSVALHVGSMFLGADKCCLHFISFDTAWWHTLRPKLQFLCWLVMFIKITRLCVGDSVCEFIWYSVNTCKFISSSISSVNPVNSQHLFRNRRFCFPAFINHLAWYQNIIATCNMLTFIISHVIWGTLLHPRPGISLEVALLVLLLSWLSARCCFCWTIADVHFLQLFIKLTAGEVEAE